MARTQNLVGEGEKRIKYCVVREIFMKKFCGYFLESMENNKGF